MCAFSWRINCVDYSICTERQQLRSNTVFNFMTCKSLDTIGRLTENIIFTGILREVETVGHCVTDSEPDTAFLNVVKAFITVWVKGPLCS
jgi:hypothetical protein